MPRSAKPHARHQSSDSLDLDEDLFHDPNRKIPMINTFDTVEEDGDDSNGPENADDADDADDASDAQPSREGSDLSDSTVCPLDADPYPLADNDPYPLA